MKRTNLNHTDPTQHVPDDAPEDLPRSGERCVRATGHGAEADTVGQNQVLEGLEQSAHGRRCTSGRPGRPGCTPVYEVVDNSIARPWRVSASGHVTSTSTVPSPSWTTAAYSSGPARQRQVRRRSVLTMLTRWKVRQRSYKVSGGLHGVGVSVVNALSKHWISRSGATVRSTAKLRARRPTATSRPPAPRSGAARRSPSSRTRDLRDDRFQLRILAQRSAELRSSTAGLSSRSTTSATGKSHISLRGDRLVVQHLNKNKARQENRSS